MTPTRPDVVTPIIHANGDRREVLLTRLAVAYDAVRAAQQALRECSPNGRNFYPEPGRMARAETQHRWRQEQLSAVEDSLEREAIQIQREAHA